MYCVVSFYLYMMHLINFKLAKKYLFCRSLFCVFLIRTKIQKKCSSHYFRSINHPIANFPTHHQKKKKKLNNNEIKMNHKHLLQIQLTGWKCKVCKQSDVGSLWNYIFSRQLCVHSLSYVAASRWSHVLGIC